MKGHLLNKSRKVSKAQASLDLSIGTLPGPIDQWTRRPQKTTCVKLLHLGFSRRPSRAVHFRNEQKIGFSDGADWRIESTRVFRRA